MFAARSLTTKLLLAAPVFVFSQFAAHAQTAPPTDTQLLSQLDQDMASVILFYDQALRGTADLDLMPADARQQFSPEDAAKALSRGFDRATAPLALGKVVDGVQIPGRDGNAIPVRIYTPAGTGPFPVITYFHGGGFVIATIDTYDASARALSKYANAIVVSVEYRKAPEAPYPAALHDAIDSYTWITRNIGTYNGIATKVAVAGESAGGNLATEVAIAARDNGLQKPTHELLVYPVTSSNTSQASDLLYTSANLPLNTSLLTYYFSNYVTNPAEANDPGVAPINANLSNLPPTTILAAQEDPLLSDGQAYAAKLQAAGNQVVYQLYTGTTHEFFGMGDVVAKAKQAEQFGAARIAASF
ncbi:alpha/beta hydrolase [Acidipila sp. EB88]|uniref:alpha/beta hydrolase n=1 Tax=Acidipila sp. EB88 TaxID=2305226 RepID=UPI000F60102B|nr:alpha/beta hydrolase [Acidipila sp. EB88]RRA47640.1 steryl acetyl hydrolase [Acidipila sp. EB88]